MDQREEIERGGRSYEIRRNILVAVRTDDKKEYSAKTSDVRKYNGSAYMIVDLDGYERGAEVILLKQESYDEIRFMCLPDPVPGYQFDPIDVYFNKK